MNKSNHRQLGTHGESKAREFFRFHGYEILSENFRWARGEIDIIARKDQTLVFIEIKTSRIHTAFGAPETWVNSHKQKQIGLTALKYLQLHPMEDVDYRFDVVGVTWDGLGNWYFQHLPNAFWLEF